MLTIRHTLSSCCSCSLLLLLLLLLVSVLLLLCALSSTALALRALYASVQSSYSTLSTTPESTAISCSAVYAAVESIEMKNNSTTSVPRRSVKKTTLRAAGRWGVNLLTSPSLERTSLPGAAGRWGVCTSASHRRSVRVR